MAIVEIIYPTARGERKIPVRLPIRDGSASQIVRAAEQDGCTDMPAVHRQLENL